MPWFTDILGVPRVCHTVKRKQGNYSISIAPQCPESCVKNRESGAFVYGVTLCGRTRKVLRKKSFPMQLTYPHIIRKEKGTAIEAWFFSMF